MITYLIWNLNVIRELTAKDNYNIIILHLNKDKKEATYEADYTLFELTERADYDKATKVMG